MELNDELLCAYLDDELERSQREQVEKALQQDPGGRLRLERMRAADERLRAEIPVRAADADDALARRILQSEQVRTAPVPRVRPSVSKWWAGGLALAAGLSGVVVGLTLLRANGGAMVAEGSRQAIGVLRDALERAPSGGAIGAQAPSAAIVLTVTTADGRHCRLFQAREASGYAEGLACRESGTWQVLAWDSTAGGAGYQTAGASPLLDAVLDRLGGAALPANDERALIERAWESKSAR